LQSWGNTATVLKESCFGLEQIANFGSHRQNLCTVYVPILCTLSVNKSTIIES
jgi:hypothetical protein